jgi:xanthine dehydrogenase YagT iron-sulfur-binding subunit
VSNRKDSGLPDPARGPSEFEELVKFSESDPSRREFLHRAATGAAAASVASQFVLAGERSQNAKPGEPDAGPLASIQLEVNGHSHHLKLDVRASLLDALREHLGLTGSKKGCDHGQCGACTVLADNRRIYSCLTLAIAAAGRSITTIEGLGNGEHLHPLQTAFLERDAFQCGYCTSGQICSAVGLLHEKHANTEAEIREQMSGNICRCGAYPNIVAAINDVREHQS